MKAVIFAAGKSTRTYPLTLTRPKPLLPLLGRPILEWQLEALEGIADTVVLVVGYRHEAIRAHFGAQWRGIRIEYVLQEEQLGTGHAVLVTEPHIDGPFLAMNGDDLYAAEDLARVARADQAALAKEVDDPRNYAIFDTTEDLRVRRLVEKPTEIFSKLSNIGVYKFTPAVFDVLRRTPLSPRGEIEITSAIQTLADEGDFRVVISTGIWYPIGYPWHMLDANEHLLKHALVAEIHGTVHPAAHLSGPVFVGKGSIIRPGVVIDGPVYIGEDCEIGPNCWLRPGATLGRGCKVGQASEIKNSILFDYAKAPHHNYVGDSIVGEGANLGCGTVTANFRHDGKTHFTVLQKLEGGAFVAGPKFDTGRRKLGAIIGDGVHTGIHTAIYPGRKLWPGVVTLPGQIVDSDIIEGGASA